MSPGEAFLLMCEWSNAELIRVASQQTNSGQETMARDILRGRMTTAWRPGG